MDIVEFLTARLDEDERIARAVDDNSAPFDGQWKNDNDVALRTYNDWVLAYKPNAEPWRAGVLDHIARHDPARVLREVAAKRAALARHASDGSDQCPNCVIDVDISYDRSVVTYAPHPCPDLRATASVYAEHPDYDPAWRVEA